MINIILTKVKKYKKNIKIKFVNSPIMNQLSYHVDNKKLSKNGLKLSNKIEDDIEKEFNLALIGVKKLPKSAKKGVFLAYSYYYSLFKKIKRTPANKIMTKRIRIPNLTKFLILVKVQILSSLRLI